TLPALPTTPAMAPTISSCGATVERSSCIASTTISSPWPATWERSASSGTSSDCRAAAAPRLWPRARLNCLLLQDPHLIPPPFRGRKESAARAALWPMRRACGLLLPPPVYRPGTSRTVVELEPIENSHFRSRRGVRSRFGPGKIRGSAWIAWKSLFGRNHGVKGLDRYAAAKAALDAMVRVQNLVFQAIQAWLPDSPKCLRCLRSKHPERGREGVGVCGR